MELAPTGVVGRVVHEHEQKRTESLEELGEPKSCAAVKRIWGTVTAELPELLLSVAV